MPHIILECSNHITTQVNCQPMLLAIHHILAEQLPTQLSNCKSRICVYDQYLIADASQDVAFAHLTIKIVSGRTDELKALLGALILQKMNDFFKQKQFVVTVQCSLELLDLSPHYFKS